MKTSGPDALSSGEKIKKIIREKRAEDEVGGEGGRGGGSGNQGERVSSSAFCETSSDSRRQFQAMQFLSEVRDNIKRISHSRLVFATSVDGLAY